MKSKLNTILLLISLALLSACGQEPNPTPSPEPTASPTPGVVPSATPEATPTPSPLPTPTPSPTPLTQVEVQDITSELFTEEQDTLHSLIVKGSKDDLRIAVIWDYNTVKMTQIHYPTHQIKSFTIQNLSYPLRIVYPYPSGLIFTNRQIAYHPSGLIFANGNCLELFSLEDNTSTPYACNSNGKKTQAIYTSQNNTLYSFGKFIPPEKLKQLTELAYGKYSERLSQSLDSSTYHLTEHTDKKTDQELFTTHPVGGPYLVKNGDASGEINTWGICPLFGWQSSNGYMNLSIKKVYYILNNYAKEPYISVSNDSKNTPLPPDIPSKIPYIQDGPIEQATLWQPHHLTVDNKQSVYFIDQFITQNKRFAYIRNIAQGQVKTLIAQTRNTGEFFPQADVYLSDFSSHATPDEYADYITLINLDEAHQTLYVATSKGELFAFDLEKQKLTLISQEIPTDLKELEVGPEGDLYAINDSSLFRIRIPEHLKMPETAPS